MPSPFAASNVLQKVLLLLSLPLLLSACTTGKLHYTDKQGNRKLGCDVEFVGLPSVDTYAVEYALSLCAHSLVKKGYTVESPNLLDIDTRIVLPPCGRKWDHELAEKHYEDNVLSDKEYGYIVAHIDLNMARVNPCKTD